MNDRDAPQPPSVRPPWLPRFGIGGMFLAISVVCVMSAGGYYCVQGLRDGGRRSQLVFILFTLSVPMLVAIIASILLWLTRPKAKRRERRK